jgi:hypothetical protein
VECGCAVVRGTAPTGRVERMVVLVSYAHNEKEDIDIDGASWLEGNCEAGSKHKGTAIRGVPKSRFTMHQMQRASAKLGTCFCALSLSSAETSSSASRGFSLKL